MQEQAQTTVNDLANKASAELLDRVLAAIAQAVAAQAALVNLPLAAVPPGTARADATMRLPASLPETSDAQAVLDAQAHLDTNAALPPGVAQTPDGIADLAQTGCPFAYLPETSDAALWRDGNAGFAPSASEASEGMTNLESRGALATSLGSASAWGDRARIQDLGVRAATPDPFITPSIPGSPEDSPAAWIPGGLLGSTAGSRPAPASLAGGPQLAIEPWPALGESPLGSLRGPDAGVRVTPSANPGAELTSLLEELEKLRSAARKAAHELANIKGPVAPPLPATPGNRGSFRI